jgi:hypothetical protein
VVGPVSKVTLGGRHLDYIHSIDDRYDHDIDELMT